MIILQVVSELPKQGLSEEWAVWIIGTLLGFIALIFTAIKWLIGLASSKVDKIVDRVEIMHQTGINQLNTCKETLLKQEIKIDEVNANIKETKYAIQTLNTKVKCMEKAG